MQGKGLVTLGDYIYFGNFFDEKFDGSGILLFKSVSGREEGNREKGTHINDPFFWPDGDVYEGNFRNGLLHGAGTYYSLEGDI